ncbi:MAG: NAD(P)H-dependent oxidoreductase [Gammaproteobacteria bacterium]|nr:NAD(P)H-dependent oxidoreductase [Gammaproteobacteria bacterium]
MPKTLLIVCHKPSENTRALADALQRGAQHPDLQIRVNSMEPLKADATDVLEADAIILGTTENFGYMSGALKDFFDRIYYPCLEHTQGLPYALMVRAGLDGSGTINAVERIVTGLRWNAVQPPLLCKGDFNELFIEQCEELGLLMAAGLDSGVF